MAFSYDHHAFLLDYAYLPTSPIGMPLLPQLQAEELNSAPSCFLYPYPSAEMIPYVPGTDARTYDRNSSPESATDAPSVDSTTCDSSKLGEPHSLEKKRKNKDAEVSKSSRYCNTRNGLKELESKKKRAIASKDSGEAAPGYIQVRARRGQATDSHSLAERVRREKISQRMKMLQGLVPGCEKVNGKTHMLDEIINYVQSLQNQVEFLSMTLASLSPMLYGFALDMDGYNNLQGKVMRRMPQTTVSPADQRMHIEPTTSTGNESTNYEKVDNSAPHLLQGQGSNFPQDSGSSVMQVGEDRLLRQIQLVNMWSFQ